MMKVMMTQADRLIPKLVKAVQDLTERVDNGFKQVDQRFKQVDKRFEQVDKRFEQVEKRVGQVEQGMATKDGLRDLEARMNQRFDESEAMTGRGFAAMQEQIYQLATKDDLAKVANQARV